MHAYFNLRWAGMILTLISLAELEGVFRGLYFFSRGGASDGPELFNANTYLIKKEISVSHLWVSMY